MAAAYQRFLDNAQDASSEAAGDVSQVGSMITGANLTQYLPGCGINVSQALNLLAQATNLAKTAASNVSSAFAAADCQVPADIAALLTEAETAPTWEGFPGDTYGTVYTTGSGAGTCLDTQSYLPSVEKIVSAAEQAVSLAAAALPTCAAKVPRSTAPVHHVPPPRTTGPTGNRPVVTTAPPPVRLHSVSEGTKASRIVGPVAARGVGQVPTVSNTSTSSSSSSGSTLPGVILESAVGLGILGLIFGGIVGVFRDEVGETASIGGIVGALIGATGGVIYANQQNQQQAAATTPSTDATSGG
jgi:hypothetical protein